jgi:large subunit ribosomal protein L13
MLPKGPLGRKMAKNAKIYAGTSHPHGSQKPAPIEA